MAMVSAMESDLIEDATILSEVGQIVTSSTPAVQTLQRDVKRKIDDLKEQQGKEDPIAYLGNLATTLQALTDALTLLTQDSKTSFSRDTIFANVNQCAQLSQAILEIFENIPTLQLID